MQEFTTPVDGVYKLEVWGAEGGYVYVSGEAERFYGGKGGYSIGYKSLDLSQKLYVCVGGAGAKATSYLFGKAGGNGGYNGGGNGGNGFADDYHGGAGGGGATHIAISNYGELKNYEEHPSEVIIVAGGGGGAGAYSKSTNQNGAEGAGGGLSGGNTSSRYDTYVITGATQALGYAFGQGQDGKSKTTSGSHGTEGTGGGGGGYYGGYACQEERANSDCGGSGGSGYIDNVTNGATIAGDQTFPKPKGGTEAGHSGDGYVIISWISPSL